MEETLFTAARRVVRNIRIDDERHGGLLSRDTINSNEILARYVEDEEFKLKQGPAQHAVYNGIHFTYRSDKDLIKNAKELGAKPTDTILIWTPGHAHATSCIVGQFDDKSS